MPEPTVIISRDGSLGRLHLNRPKAINSLTLEMVHLINEGLTRFEADNTVAAVLLTGEGERGLCAGGDIIALYNSGKAGDGMAAEFWRDEYRLNARIAEYPKPYIAVMDGITMGGGVGLSAHASQRIVTERTRLAMPETGIGTFPDVGGTWLLSNAIGEAGTYIGLTGSDIDAADAIHTGFADHFLSSAQIPALAASLASLPPDASEGAVELAIRALAEVPPASGIQHNQALIDAAFAADSVEEILAALSAQNTAFSDHTAQTLAAKSPTCLKLTLRLLRAARGSHGLKACLDREYAATSLILSWPDFYEGVRAAVIDKDRAPKWQPQELRSVTLPPLEAVLSPPRSLFEHQS
ncbi:enoyl-CoA hydratase/isomerase family protein [Oceanicola sp. 502str15]|uniref:enoyl-CoA hydratase/isomerase family protein n=1 Tax=Oceanicola sp. 502str15 TaxID=2696061 RepID=UPI00209557A0|nr:enoyl-CoA hydratase/isomerase family protein [Oceanicola sp. 502str15]MCO6381733.1 enoyl-CoA hydratase/isomerase family protein [Oceanicola sp. 502str15]